MKKIQYYICLMFLGTTLTSCVEEIRFETESFESLLVVDATITDEEKQQTIYLSRTFPFEELGPSPLSSASVELIGDGTSYPFQETNPGEYTSVLSFKAVPNVAYSLQITLDNGTSYESTKEMLTTKSTIDSMYVIRENNLGVDGASIYVDATSFSNDASYFRYEYMETFRLIPPLWREEELVTTTNDTIPCGVEFKPRSTAEKVSYRTEFSNEVDLATTSELSQNTLKRHRFRFIAKNDYRIGHRYSVALKQLAITSEAYEYFSRIKSFSSSESLFSQVQAGFIDGNIQAVSNTSEKVVGYFGVATVSTKRIFFNFVDYFQGEPAPDYISECALTAPKCDNLPQVVGFLSYLRPNDGTVYGDLYVMVPRACGYGSAVGSLEVPDFWVE